MKISSIFQILICLSLLITLNPSNLLGQCEGTKNDGNPFMLRTDGGNTSVVFNVGGISFTIEFNAAIDKLLLSGTGGTTFHTDGNGNVIRLEAGVDVSTLAIFEGGKVVLFDKGNNTGAFGGGISGFIGIQNNGRFGWLHLSLCGLTTCADYRFTLTEGGFDNIEGNDAETGNCSTLCVDAADTDQDGTFDCQDGCPTDPGKIAAGNCGCNVPERAGDADGDGTIDCKDGCPDDPNKSTPGICGCGTPDTQDSDGDGTPDCVDECPLNPNKIIAGSCGCEAPGISRVELSDYTNCTDNGTYDPSDDTFTAVATVTFDHAPRLGAIEISGHTDFRFDFSNDNFTQTVFEFTLSIRADGKPIDLIVNFINNEGCIYRFRGGNAPSGCSDAICDIPGSAEIAMNGNKATLSWETVDNSQSFEYCYRVIGTEDWKCQWTDQLSCDICDLNLESDYEYSLRSLCVNGNKSAYHYGTFQTGDSEMDCFEEDGSGECTIKEIRVNNIRNCHDRGSIDQDDDYFYGDLVVSFENAPLNGTLDVEGNVIASVDVSNLSDATYHEFPGLRFSEGGGVISLTASFSENSDCDYSIEYSIPSNPCYAGRLTNESTGTELPLLSAGNTDLPNGFEPISYLNVFPNPVNDELFVEYQFPKNTVTNNTTELILFDAYGRLIYSQILDKNGSGQRLNTTGFESGIYHLVLKSDDQMLSKRIVKR